jgi:peptidoglycan/xylan/chitin deacetylase (PgdA/CDA1 family)
MRSVPILTFHSLDDSGSTVATAPRHFDQEMERLAAAGWTGCGVGRILDWTRGAADLPQKSLGICFDDGYRNVSSVALPTLRRHGFTATVFVITGRCGSDNRWPGQSRTIPAAPLLDWDELGALVAAGWEIGAHGATHAPLVHLSREQIADEVEGARESLARRLGVDAALFAYPYGAFDATVRDAVERSYQGACGVRMGAVRRGSDPYDLPRFDAYYLRSRSYAETLGGSAGRAYLTLRGWIRRLRRRRPWEPV